MNEFFYFYKIEESREFFLDCLERGIWAEIDCGNPHLFGVKVDIAKTCNEKNRGEYAEATK